MLIRPRINLIAVFLISTMLPNFIAASAKPSVTPKSDIEAPNPRTNDRSSDEPAYLLNLPLSFGAGFLGTMFGVTVAALIGMPILSISGDCKITLSGHNSRNESCTEAGYNAQNFLLSAGGIVGAFTSIHFVSRWMGFRHKWWQSLIGATIGIAPFSYYYYHAQRGSLGSTSTGGSENPHLDYGIVSVVLSTMLFTYIGSFYDEFTAPISKIEQRPIGTFGKNEVYGSVGFRFRF